mgnify:CR=1 FL=1
MEIRYTEGPPRFGLSSVREPYGAYLDGRNITGDRRKVGRLALGIAALPIILGLTLALQLALASFLSRPLTLSIMAILPLGVAMALSSKVPEVNEIAIKIMDVLSEGKRLTAKEIASKLNLPKHVVLYHLNKLRSVFALGFGKPIVMRMRRGRAVVWWIPQDYVKDVEELKHQLGLTRR